MDCDKPPTKEVLWLDKKGTGHAWFCDEHHTGFVKDTRHTILFSRPVNGKATESWAMDYTRRGELSEAMQRHEGTDKMFVGEFKGKLLDTQHYYSNKPMKKED